MTFPIAFEFKDLIGLAIILPAFFATILALLLSTKLRDIALFIIVVGSVLSQNLDINFFGADWYRGTSRGFELTFVDILAGALLSCALLDGRERKWYWPAGLAPLLLFILWSAFTVAVLKPWIFGSYEFFKMLRGLLLFLTAAFCVRTPERVFVFAGGLTVAVLMQAIWGLHQWSVGVYRVTGTLDHANSLSMYLCLVTPVIVAVATSHWTPKLLRYLAWVTAVAAIPAILLTLSRTGMPVFALVVGGSLLGCISWKITLQKVALAGVALVILGGMLSQTWDQIEARYGQATLTGEFFDEGSEGRGFYFRQAKVILEGRPFGVGLNNWSYVVSKEFTSELGLRYSDYDALGSTSRRKIDVNSGPYAPPAHNLGLITLGEMGWIGLFLFTIAWIRWFQVGISGFKGSRESPLRFLTIGIFFGFVGIFLKSLTKWTFRQTEIFMTFSLLLGVLAALHQARKEPPIPAREATPEGGWESQ